MISKFLRWKELPNGFQCDFQENNIFSSEIQQQNPLILHSFLSFIRIFGVFSFLKLFCHWENSLDRRTMESGGGGVNISTVYQPFDCNSLPTAIGATTTTYIVT
jgi:hypothetical protein